MVRRVMKWVKKFFRALFEGFFPGVETSGSEFIGAGSVRLKTMVLTIV
jgi:hypothetical protein